MAGPLGLTAARAMQAIGSFAAKNAPALKEAIAPALTSGGKEALKMLNAGGSRIASQLAKQLKGAESGKLFDLGKLSDFAKQEKVEPSKLTQAHVEESGSIVREGLKALKQFMLDKTGAHDDEGKKQKIDDVISALENLPLPGHESFKPHAAKLEQAIIDMFSSKPSHQPEPASEPEHKPEPGKVEADAGHAQETGEGKSETGVQQKPASETPVKAEGAADHQPDHKTDTANDTKAAAGPHHSEKSQVEKLKDLKEKQAKEQEDMAEIRMQYDRHMAQIEMMVRSHQKMLEMLVKNI